MDKKSTSLPLQDKSVMDWLMTNNFCAMPFVHVAVESNGDIRPCCLGGTLRNDDGSTLNIAGKSIQDIINHPTHIKFRQSFIDNEQHSACHPCWGKFLKDPHSGRLSYSASHKTDGWTRDVMNGAKPEQKLIWLEIKAGNRCNLSCRICGLWNSARWLKETYDLHKSENEQYPEFKSSPEFEYNQQAKWIDDVDFWRNIEGFDDVKIIHIMGGEPLMIEEHFEMLDSISKKFDASKITIWYNTNGTTLPTKDQEEILNRFMEVKWSLSIDDIGERFDYQRSGAAWSQVKSYIPYFYSKPNFTATIDLTVSIFNIATIDEFLRELKDMNILESFGPHFVTSDHSSYNVRSLHADIKRELTIYLEGVKLSIGPKSIYHINRILDYMNSIDLWSQDKDDERRRNITRIDKSRNEDFTKIFPKMAGLLNYE